MIRPISLWIRSVTQRIIYPVEPIIITNSRVVDSGPFAPIPGVIPGSSCAPNSNDVKTCLDPDFVTTQIGHPPYTLISLDSNCSSNIASSLRRSPAMGKPFNHSIKSQAPIMVEPSSMTLPTTTPIQGQTQVHQEQARYFTYDGEHRKFYLAARYLRSAQRERRHKRRQTQHLRQRARNEYNRMQNTLSYGQLYEPCQKKKIHEKNKSQDSLPEHTLDIESLESDPILEGDTEEIQLICWKDIDLDLEVRSIDDETELARLSRLDQQATRNRRMSREHPSVIRSNPLFDREPGKVFVNKSNYSIRKSNSIVEPWEKDTSESFILANEEIESFVNSKLLRTVATAATSVGSDSTRVRTLHISEPTVHSKQTISTFNETSLEDASLVKHPVRPNPAGRQDLVRQTSLVMTLPCVPARPSVTDTHVGSDRKKKTGNCVSKSKSSVPCRLPLYPSETGNNHIQSALHSTVISNPMALKGMSDSPTEKPAITEGKSRLSIASSMGDLNSDFQIQLSYYSQEGTKTEEEDLSFFSFGDGFNSDEDVSQVTVPISLSLLIMTTYIIIGAVVFSMWEDKKYLKWSYFCFITLTTIGFGDIVPGTKIDSQNTKEKMVIISLYVAIGLSVFAMCFKLMQEEVVDKFKWFANKARILRKRKRQEKSLSFNR